VLFTQKKSGWGRDKFYMLEPAPEDWSPHPEPEAKISHETHHGHSNGLFLFRSEMGKGRSTSSYWRLVYLGDESSYVLLQTNEEGTRKITSPVREKKFDWVKDFSFATPVTNSGLVYRDLNDVLRFAFGTNKSEILQWFEGVLEVGPTLLSLSPLVQLISEMGVPVNSFDFADGTRMFGVSEQEIIEIYLSYFPKKINTRSTELARGLLAFFQIHSESSSIPAIQASLENTFPLASWYRVFPQVLSDFEQIGAALPIRIIQDPDTKKVLCLPHEGFILEKKEKPSISGMDIDSIIRRFNEAERAGDTSTDLLRSILLYFSKSVIPAQIGTILAQGGFSSTDGRNWYAAIDLVTRVFSAEQNQSVIISRSSDTGLISCVKNNNYEQKGQTISEEEADLILDRFARTAEPASRLLLLQRILEYFVENPEPASLRQILAKFGLEKPSNNDFRTLNALLDFFRHRRMLNVVIEKNESGKISVQHSFEPMVSESDPLFNSIPTRKITSIVAEDQNLREALRVLCVAFARRKTFLTKGQIAFWLREEINFPWQKTIEDLASIFHSEQSIFPVIVKVSGREVLLEPNPNFRLQKFAQKSLFVDDPKGDSDGLSVVENTLV